VKECLFDGLIGSDGVGGTLSQKSKNVGNRSSYKMNFFNVNFEKFHVSERFSLYTLNKFTLYNACFTAFRDIFGTVYR
jgi:hypothetical protein